MVYHLAGQASPSRSWDIPAQTLLINTIGTVNLLEAAVSMANRGWSSSPARIFTAMSAPPDLPLTEASVAQPRHPYGVSKLAAAQFVPLYWARHGLPVVEARPFNHIGPRQALGFVVPDFASQLAAITLGQAPPRMRVGNLDAQRDFTDVRDVVAAYRMLALAGQPGQGYLICSGQPVTIHYLLSTLVALSGQQVDIEYDPARIARRTSPAYTARRRACSATPAGHPRFICASRWPSRWMNGSRSWQRPPARLLILAPRPEGNLALIQQARRRGACGIVIQSWARPSSSRAGTTSEVPSGDQIVADPWYWSK